MQLSGGSSFDSVKVRALLPELQSPRIILRRVHVEETQPFRVKAAEFLLADFVRPYFIVKKYRSKLAALELLFQQRQLRSFGTPRAEAENDPANRERPHRDSDLRLVEKK